MRSTLSKRERIESLKIFASVQSHFFNAKCAVIPVTAASFKRASLMGSQMRQNVILTHSGYTMYIVITDLEKKAKPAMFRISRPGLPFQKMERKLAGSMSSLLSGYYSKFYRRRDLERVIPALSHEFLQTAIAHQLKLANFSIEESLSIIKEFEKIVLWSYEGEPVATGLLLTRNFHDLKKIKHSSVSILRLSERLNSVRGYLA